MIRLADFSDLESILAIYSSARKYMRNQGNPNQWINGYPQKEMLISDIEQGHLYVFEDENGIFGVFALIIGEDPAYQYIEGKWLTENRLYGTIHRIASDGSHHGLLQAAVDFSFKQVDVLRIDTHHDNHKMQSCIDRCGFEKCGIIYLEDGSPRIGYEMINLYNNKHEN